MANNSNISTWCTISTTCNFDVNVVVEVVTEVDKIDDIITIIDTTYNCDPIGIEMGEFELLFDSVVVVVVDHNDN